MASTIDRRPVDHLRVLPTRHIDGRIASNPAQYVRRPSVHYSERRVSTPGDHAHAALALLLSLVGLRVSER